jgi:hypothetical protein
MKLAAATVSALTVPVDATGYLRIIWKTHRSSPMGMGYGKTRFASPDDRFKLLYAARDLTTALAETIVRDRFDRRKTRSILEDELHERAIASLVSTAPLNLLDLRTTGATRLGISTNVPRGKAQGPGRRFSASLHEQTDLDGILYRSRITNDECIAVYDRAASKLDPSAQWPTS